MIEALGESGQRVLLERLCAVLSSSPLGGHTPVGVVVLEAMALLLEVLGEVSPETRAALEPAIGAKVSGPHACLRLQAASAAAALAAAEPSGAARLLAACLANLRAAVLRLVEATAGAAPDRSRQAPPATPRGVGSVRLKPDMNAVHGWALTAAALAAAAQRLPLGVPSELLSGVLRLAENLISCRAGTRAGTAAAADANATVVAATTAQQQQQGPVASLQREAGYILLGALCAASPASPALPSSSAGRQRLLQQFLPALGPQAAAEMDRRYCSNAVRQEWELVQDVVIYPTNGMCMHSRAQLALECPVHDCIHIPTPT